MHRDRSRPMDRTLSQDLSVEHEPVRPVPSLPTSSLRGMASAALVASLLAACGGGGGGASPAPAPVASSPPPTTAPVPTPVPAPTPAPVPAPPPPTSSIDAARLLDQAAFGPTEATVGAVQGQGAAAWVDAQLATPATGYAAIDFIDANSTIGCPTGAAATCYRDNYTPFPLQLQFFRNAATGPDQLRQRVALAYAQIFVISGIDIKPTYGMRAYQQMLLDNAFSNYRVLLEHVTLHPAMGDYLDMVNNDKPNPAKVSSRTRTTPARCCSCSRSV